MNLNEIAFYDFGMTRLHSFSSSLRAATLLGLHGTKMKQDDRQGQTNLIS